MDCEYWQKEYRQLFRSHRQIEERAATLEKRCTELERALEVTLREQRQASRNPLPTSSDTITKSQTIASLLAPRLVRPPPPASILKNEQTLHGCILGLQIDPSCKSTQHDNSLFYNCYTPIRHPFSSSERSRQSIINTTRSTSQVATLTKKKQSHQRPCSPHYDSFNTRSRSEGNIDQWCLDEASQDSSTHPYNSRSWKSP